MLLLDEPTEGIQPSIIKDLARTLKEIRNLRDLTIVVSEQVLSFTRREIADRFGDREGQVRGRAATRSTRRASVAIYRCNPACCPT